MENRLAIRRRRKDMAKVTDLVFQQKNKNRVNVFLDGEFKTGLDAAAAVRAGLKIGREIDDSELDELVRQSDGALAFEKAAKYLGMRLVSKKKMGEYLTGKGFSAEVAEETVRRLEELGYIDDLNFAVAYIKSSGAGCGDNLIKYKLCGFGIAREIIDSALEKAKPEGEGEAADKTAAKYLRTHVADKRKLYTYLVGRGFSYDSARTAAEKAISNIEENE